ncbi:VOC family protein [Gimibacter soli]|uniref:VOC domain-containing protein n=1 Tax=Gimibacter soli TaxID=3024400 RepID=A0AAF0BGN2_9PROT|nr:VOC family protein [Gimibacter soli]WCL53683.1 hypothetical protein PH603_14175 [Gimibacter soli]
MKPAPKDWPRLSSSIFYEDAPIMIDWLMKAFDFKLKIRVEGETPGVIMHAELTYGEAIIMVGSHSKLVGERFGTSYLSPREAGGCTQSLMLYVPDIEAHHATAKAAGANILAEPAISDYGPEYWSDKAYGVLDPEGHLWWFAERLRNPPGI